MAEEKAVSFQFDAVATHEIVDTMHAISNFTHCKWMVMGWAGRANSGLLVRNSIGWLTTHLNSNFALFKDNGVRYIRKILVCLRPGKEDIRFLQITDRIAQYHGADFTFCRVIPENMEREERDKLRAVSEKLLEGVKSVACVEIKASNHPVETIIEIAASYDLLITGTPLEDNMIKTLFGSGRDKFADGAPCSVLRLTIKSSDS